MSSSWPGSLRRITGMPIGTGTAGGTERDRMAHRPIVYLSVTSYVGILGWAQHYYGTLRCKDKEFHLQHIMTAAEAEAANYKQTYNGWEEGSETSAFPTEEAVRKEAIRVWRGKLLPGAILVVGSHASCGPMEVLDGPSPLKEQLMKLYDEAEKIGWWDGRNEKRMDELCSEWENLVPEDES